MGKKIYFLFLLILIIFPLINAINYSSGNYSSGNYSSEETSIIVGTATSGGGSGGGGSSSTVITPNISINPTEINVDLAVNTNKQYIINITNPRRSKVTLNISQNNLDGMVILNRTSLELRPKETKKLRIVFVALNKTGIFTGKIIIGNKEVLVSLNIKTKLLLFDSNIVVLNKDYKVEQGKKLETKISLIPMGDKNRLDVALNYVIENYNGKVYLTKSETVLVKNRMEFNREFDTGGLPVGEYIVGLELVYPKGVASSSAYFEVTKKESSFPPSKRKPLKIWFVIWVISLFIIVLIIIIYLIKKKSKRLSEVFWKKIVKRKTKDKLRKRIKKKLVKKKSNKSKRINKKSRKAKKTKKNKIRKKFIKKKK